LAETLLFVAGLAGLGAWLWHAIPVLPGLLRPRFIADTRVPAGETAADPPRVSVIVPACNEAGMIRRCVQSLLDQDYPSLEIIAVDDRSTDGTGALLDELAAANLRLTARHVTELPPGWLGKNHANHTGAAAAGGDWLLFTDGDVIFQRDAIRLAMAHAEPEGLDHLCLFPGLICGTFLERAACCFFGILFTMALQVRHVRNPLRPGAFCGVGAFNLVRRTAYEAIGTHARLRLEVADDVKLGKLLKRAGFVSDVLAGWPQVSVRWQQGLGGVIRGLEKNAFCGADYRVGRSLYLTVCLAVLGLAPVGGAVFAPGWARVPFAAALATQVALLGLAARRQGFGWSVGLGFPVAAVALAVAQARSTLLALCRGGIRWRGTFYPLGELRRELI
jgi:hypothetical protein